MSLRLRFSLMISSVIVLLFTGYIVSIYLIERQYLTDDLTNGQKADVEKLSLICQESFLSKDEIVLINFMKELKRSPAFVWAMFLAPDGTVLHHSDLTQKNKMLEDEASRALSKAQEMTRRITSGPDGRNILDYAMPVYAGGQRIGTARIGFSDAIVQSFVSHTLSKSVRRFSGISIVTLALGLGMAILVANNLAKPIAQLTNGATEIGRGNWQVALPTHRADEIGKLAKSVSSMADRLRDLDKLKDEFIANVSHDLRNPLGSISTAATFFLTRGSENLSKPQLQVARIIRDSAQQLVTMVNNILDVGKMKEGKLQFNKAPTAAGEIIQRVAELNEFTARENEKNLKADVPADLPAVYADAEMLQRIFQNLISNALKFTRKDDTITVGAHLSNPNEVTFFVQDTGLGIEQDKIPFLFQRYGTVSDIDVDFKQRQGAGLGLSIVKGIVEGHGGRIWVESEIDRGTKFSWTMPVFQAA